MGSLAEIVKTTVFEYVAGGDDHRMYGVANDDQQVYAVLAVGYPVHKRPTDVVLMARVVGDQVVIESDLTDRPFYQALQRQGIDPHKIIRAYMGDPLPEEAPVIPA